MDKNENIKEYNEDKQKLLIDVLLSSEEIYVRCQNILNQKYFVNKLRPAVRFIMEHAGKYNILPKVEQVNAETGLQFNYISDIKLQHQDAFLDEIEEFCKNRALADAILGAVDLIEKGNYGEVEKRVRDAILVGLQSDLGTNYFADPKSRLQKIKNNNGQFSTGWKDVDDKLYGGVNRGELTIWCAGSGVGKSLFLQNLAINFANQGLNVIYLSLELSEELCSMRMDSMISEISTRDIFKRIDEVEIKVKKAGYKSGSIFVKQLPQGSTCNDIKAYLKNYEIETQKKPDALVVDYLDLLFPNNKKIDPSNLYIKDKFVTEELRGVLVERKMIGQSAAQLNRGSINEQEHDHSHISGGISKIQTADNVISILASTAMKERGQYQIQFLKTRSSSGVGSKLNLGFDPNTLRIFNFDDESQSIIPTNTNTADVFDNIRRKNAKKPEPVSEPTKSIKDLSSLTALLKR